MTPPPPPGSPPVDAVDVRQELFGLRVARWVPDLRDALAELYPAGVALDLERRLLEIAARAYRQRPDDLHRLDQARTLAPDWFQHPSMLGYAAYADRFGATLAGVQKQIPYLAELGVTYLHLMPLLRPREGDSDGGYAVADYRTVRADLGGVDDLVELATALRREGISLVLDLVLNHVAREHEWARRARAGETRYRDYFLVFPDRSGPDAFEQTLPEVFPDFAPGNFTWDRDLDAWVWTTFNHFQWDLNWANPDVVAEFVDLVLWLANCGVEVLRLDAIAFMWKRLGTNSQNQPEVHAIAQVLRALTRIVCPGLLLKAEAIVSPDDLVQYLGQGRHYGKVSDLAYHNTLMVQVWSMLASRDVGLAVHALQQLPPAPPNTAWITYLRCHDDIGWAIDDSDAGAVGLSGYGHRAFLSDFYTGAFPGSFGRGVVFQANPLTGDRRVSGSTSSLTGLSEAVAAGDAPIDLAIARVMLGHAVILGWGGVPVLWMGDELGLDPDPHWADEPGHEADNRWLQRPRMDAATQARRHDEGTVAARVWDGLGRLIAARARLPLLHAGTAAQVLDASDPGVLPVLRRHPEGAVLELFNVTESWRPWPAHRIDAIGIGCVGGVRDAITGDEIRASDDGNVWLAPYAALWLVAR